MNTRHTFTTVMAAMLILLLTGCKTPEKIAYFQDTDPNTIIEMVAEQPITVRPGDHLSIIVKSKDAAISNLFNLPVYSSRIGAGGSPNGNTVQMNSYTASGSDGIASYIVTPQGDIDFPVLGTLHVAGMTRSELSGYIKGELMGRQLVKDPTVVVDFLSTGVDVLGDVKTPGRYDMNKDKLTVLEAISLAGDLNVTGQRENVKVLRQQDGKLYTYTLNLTNTATLVKSPGYYLQQGDVVYVEPNDMQKRASTVNGNNALSVGFWISVASLLTSVVTTLAVFIKK
ncbi:MAG: polysaccharide biosynthesis/export family protein [Muribaculaceae bacterium]|nr:polysaccharide biosynthesis/export family protein [Muribaculaceae bacterium]